MGVLTRTETFQIEKTFFAPYQFLLNRYWNASMYCSLRTLLSDIRERFQCLAVALAEIYPEGTYRLLHADCENIFPPAALDTLFGESRVLPVANEPKGIISPPGTTVTTDILIGDKKLRSVPVHLIFLPRLDISEVPDGLRHCFVIVDPARFNPPLYDYAERAFQRGLLAQLLKYWWVSVSSQQDGPANLRIATLRQLVQAGRTKARELRQRVSSPEEVFLPEDGDGGFHWEEWEPLIPPRGAIPERLDILREHGRIAAYWCQWLASHKDLEDDRDHRRTEVAAIEGVLGTNRWSVADWVRSRRTDVAPLMSRLEATRSLLAMVFRVGEPDRVLGARATSAVSPLPISQRSLLAFSLSQWLAPSGRLRREISGGVLSDIEFCRLLHCIATATHYALDLQPVTDDLVHRLIQLLANYAHGDLGVPPRIDLRAHLRHAARSEPALHALTPHYRDHFFHALEVCALGNVLLDTHVAPNQPLWHLMAERLAVRPGTESARRSMVLRLWHMAALLHDIGYAMVVFKGSRTHLNLFRHSKVLQNLGKAVEDAVGTLSKSDEILRLGIRTEPELGEDHGVVSALHVQALLERIASDDPTVVASDYRSVVHAIALHNLRRHEQRIVFREEPLAFLLALCDQVQEWRRPRLAYSTAPSWMLATLSGGVPDESEIEGAFRSLTLGLEPFMLGTDDIGLYVPYDAAKRRPLLRMEIEYDDRINRNSSVFALWLDATLNFQRFDFSGLDLDICLAYRNPLFEIPGGRRGYSSVGQVSQMSRLRDAVHETHMPFLSGWLPSDPMPGDRTTNGAVTHYYDTVKKTETLVLDLRSLSSTARMTEGMDVFWNRLKEWKHFNDDRDFPGDYVPAVPE